MIKIIDYGMGNLRSVQKSFEKVGYQAEITNKKEEILNADGVVLPGVGAFKDAMENIQKLDLIDTIHQVVKEGKPFLGICLGFQLLFSESTEFGYTKGLDIISGSVKKFPDNLGLKIPHMGWNQLNLKQDNQIYDGLTDGEFQYFVHSYYVETEDKDVIGATTDYGIEFVSSIVKDNVYGAQFHPEKSSDKGLQVLKNFGKIVEMEEE
ncbi:imidazole glycerol phosphate synthase, glutamine amidotransferase subunit [Orenia metallireducens]|uniref:Imidazole glycerol phosphate synthase subunit HisH n=1 Tax=Orenia metallireducens TaxID=1413210 RepID=A0A1C0A7I1_9FIRM|nr:imidazole glycerol phosphate synthase subunit HisH [Orenia metallireducens]OCL26174.1 imidazole glycerol phosphate synthase, glutamine amidotransferase subunit [Orenia metallireducens]